MSQLTQLCTHWAGGGRCAPLDPWPHEPCRARRRGSRPPTPCRCAGWLSAAPGRSACASRRPSSPRGGPRPAPPACRCPTSCGRPWRGRETKNSHPGCAAAGGGSSEDRSRAGVLASCWRGRCLARQGLERSRNRCQVRGHRQDDREGYPLVAREVGLSGWLVVDVVGSGRIATKRLDGPIGPEHQHRCVLERNRRLNYHFAPQSGGRPRIRL